MLYPVKRQFRSGQEHFRPSCPLQKRSQFLPPTMKFLHVLAALLTVLAVSPSTILSLTTDTDLNISTYHVPVRCWPARATIQPRMHGARPDEVSLSPPALPNSPASALNITKKHNNSTSSFPQILPQTPTWVLTLEDLVTAIYRIVSIVLTLFNINITWRFHGKCHSNSTHLDQADVSTSPSRSSAP